MKWTGYFLNAVQVLIIILASFTTTMYRELVVVHAICILLLVLDKLGKGIVLREMIALHSSIVCLLMPLLGFVMYPKSNPLARLWVKYMPVEELTYFEFTLPAIVAFTTVLCWPIQRKDGSDQGAFLSTVLERAREVLLRQPRHSVWLLITGVVLFQLMPIIPADFKFVVTLIYYTSFVGLLYVFFSANIPHRRLYLLVFVLIILADALRNGMFTIVAYMGITIFSFYFLGKKASLLKKTAIFAAALFVLLVIQTVKPKYRSYTWYGNYSGSKTALFVNLVVDKVSKGDIFEPNSFFWIYYRLNQGYNVALVMRRMPSIQPHDQGKNLTRSIAASVVPRFLWPDKPQAGGKYNMKYYAGYYIKGWSTNVGPLGEAYGGFGVTGGIIYMFLLGVLIRWAYSQVLLISRRIPLMIFWIPVLFYQITYSAETDTLQIFNSLIKSAFLVWMLFKLLPDLFGYYSNSAPAKVNPALQH